MASDYYLLIGLLIVACYWDFRYKKLPNWLTVTGTVCGLIFHYISGGFSGFTNALIAGLAAGGVLLILYLFRAVGAGDVKLFAGIGAIAGIHFVLFCMMYSVFYAGIIAVIILLFTRTFMKKIVYAFHKLLLTVITRDMKVLEDYKNKESTCFAFMYAVLPAAVTAGYYLNF